MTNLNFREWDIVWLVSIRLKFSSVFYLFAGIKWQNSFKLMIFSHDIEKFSSLEINRNEKSELMILSSSDNICTHSIVYWKQSFLLFCWFLLLIWSWRDWWPPWWQWSQRMINSLICVEILFPFFNAKI